MGGVAFFALYSILVGAFFDGPNVHSERFVSQVFLAAADVFGALVGALFAVLVFALVLVVYERQQPDPDRLEPPNAEQLTQASRMIAQQMEGGDEDE